MTYISYKKLWDSEINNIVSTKGKVQDMNINQLKLKLIDIFNKDEKKQQNVNLLITQML